MGLSVEQASRLYKIPVIDYGSGREDDWLLVTAGTGLMLSLMDQEPRFRYCIDTDGIRDTLGYRFGQWLICMEQSVGRIGVAGWYSNPANARALIQCLLGVEFPKQILTYLGATVTAGMLEGLEAVFSLRDFLGRLRPEYSEGA